MNIFISHASKNAWIIDDLMRLIYTAGHQPFIFCSSEENAIRPFEDFKEEIYKNLKNADVFIALVSKEYWESKYCAFELGAAYERYCNADGRQISIQPLLLPPLKKGEALAGTPLVEMQLCDLTSPLAVMEFLRYFSGENSDKMISDLNVAIGKLCTEAREYGLRKTSLYDAMNADAFFDERGKIPVPRDRIVKCRRSGDSFEFTFNLSLLDYGDDEPSFASVALMYYDIVNLRQFLSYDPDAAFSVDVNNIDGVLKGFDVEFKSNINNQVIRVPVNLEPGENKVLIPLRGWNFDAMESLHQICFVVHPSEMNAMDGEVVFRNVHVEFETKNILK